MNALPVSPSPAAIKASAPPRKIPAAAPTPDNVFEAEQAFFQRYVDIQPLTQLMGQSAFTALDLHRRKPVLLRCFRAPWESSSLETAIRFGRLDSPFALPVKDVSQRPTETVLVSNLFDFSIEEWVISERVDIPVIERIAGQIGDWMMEWKEHYHSEVALDLNLIRIGRTRAKKPFCRIIGGNPHVTSAEAVSALRTVLGSLVLWHDENDSTGAAPNTEVKFDETRSLSELNLARGSWLAWLLEDSAGDRPQSVGEWLLNREGPPRSGKAAHHELGPDSPWPNLQP